MHPQLSHQVASVRAEDARRIAEARRAHAAGRHYRPKLSLWRYFVRGHQAHQQSVRGTRAPVGGTRPGVAGRS